MPAMPFVVIHNIATLEFYPAIVQPNPLPEENGEDVCRFTTTSRLKNPETTFDTIGAVREYMKGNRCITSVDTGAVLEYDDVGQDTVLHVRLSRKHYGYPVLTQ